MAQRATACAVENGQFLQAMTDLKEMQTRQLDMRRTPSWPAAADAFLAGTHHDDANPGPRRSASAGQWGDTAKHWGPAAAAVSEVMGATHILTFAGLPLDLQGQFRARHPTGADPFCRFLATRKGEAADRLAQFLPIRQGGSRVCEKMGANGGPCETPDRRAGEEIMSRDLGTHGKRRCRMGRLYHGSRVSLVRSRMDRHIRAVGGRITRSPGDEASRWRRGIDLQDSRHRRRKWS